jgi:Bacteriophage Sf6, terminase small subunit-like
MKNVKKQEIRPTGRPSSYTLEVADEICERMTKGEGLLRICSDEEMPSRVTVYRWLDANEAFRSKYARAREALMDFYAEQILGSCMSTRAMVTPPLQSARRGAPTSRRR